MKKSKLARVFLVTLLLTVTALNLFACGSSLTVSGSDTVVVGVEERYGYVAVNVIGDVVWAISGENTVGAIISDDGVFKAIAPGTVSISVTVGKKTATKKITIVAASEA